MRPSGAISAVSRGCYRSSNVGPRSLSAEAWTKEVVASKQFARSLRLFSSPSPQVHYGSAMNSVVRRRSSFTHSTMDSRNGYAAGPSERRGRKSRKLAREDVGGASGSGDGSETEATFPFHGVSFPSPKVEIKNYVGSLHFHRTIRGASRGEAAMVYDLAQYYKDPNFPEDNLNIRKVVHFLVKENAVLPEPQHLRRGKEFCLNFMREHSLTIPCEQWTKENLAAVLDEIVAKGSECHRALKEEIARKCCVRGRQRTDLDEILPSLPEDDSHDLQQCLDDLKDENHDLKVENQDLKDKIAKLEELLQKASLQSQPEVLPPHNHFSEGWWENDPVFN